MALSAHASQVTVKRDTYSVADGIEFRFDQPERFRQASPNFLPWFKPVFRALFGLPLGLLLKLTIPQAPEGAISTLEIPALAISSTDIRRRVDDSQPVWYLVPDGVVQYIAKNELYGQHD